MCLIKFNLIRLEFSRHSVYATGRKTKEMQRASFFFKEPRTRPKSLTQYFLVISVLNPTGNFTFHQV